MRIGTEKLKNKEYAVFTPQAVAKSLKREKASPKEEAPQRSNNSNSAPSVTIDGTVVAEKLLDLGLRLFSHRQRKLKKRQAQLDHSVLSLAKRLNGFLGVPDLLGFEVCGESEGLDCLKRLSLGGHCNHLCEYKEDSVYVFPKFIQRVWVCEYCESHFPIEDHQGDSCACSNCSAPMERGIL